MAIFRPSALVGAISGNFGGVNFVASARGAIVRPRQRKTDPKSTEQLAVRNAYNQLWHLWQNLTQDQQAPWTVAALLFPRTNRLGINNPLTGWQLFYETNFYDVWRQTPTSPPFQPVPPPLSAAQALTDLVLTATRGIGFALTVRSLIPSTDANHPGILTMRAVRPHTTIVKKVYRDRRTLDRADFTATTISIADEFIEAFGIPALGEVLQFQFGHVADLAAAAPDPKLPTRQSATITKTIVVTEPDPNPFEPPAMNYDRINDWSLRGAPLTGAADTQTVTVSAFLRTNTTGGTEKNYMGGRVNRYNFTLLPTNTPFVFVRNAAGVTIAQFTLDATIPSDGSWHNVCFSVDWTVPQITAAVDGVEVSVSITTLTAAATADWTVGDHAIGARESTGRPYEGCLSMIWFSITNALDFTDPNVRALFVNADGTPNDLGGAGQFPTGTSPIVFLPGGDGASNGGTGGNYVNNAAVVACVTTP